MMALCHVFANDISLLASQEFIITWAKGEENKHHTKPEYLKILQDGSYNVSYEIKWQHMDATTQPLRVTIYKVTKDFSICPLHQHVTVCTGNPITLKKSFPFDLKAGERICIGVKNMSNKNFILINSKLSLTQT
jgi:hypothetical protein